MSRHFWPDTREHQCDRCGIAMDRDGWCQRCIREVEKATAQLAHLDPREPYTEAYDEPDEWGPGADEEPGWTFDPDLYEIREAKRYQRREDYE